MRESDQCVELIVRNYVNAMSTRTAWQEALVADLTLTAMLPVLALGIEQGTQLQCVPWRR